MGHSFVTSLR